MGEQDYAENSADAGQRLRFQVEYSQAALKNLHLVNGGSIVALLTLVGNSKIEFDERSIWGAFFWFSAGLSLSLLAYFGAYFSQSYFMDTSALQAWNAQADAHGVKRNHDIRPSHRMGNLALCSAISCAAASLGSFITGAFVALGGIL